MSHYQLPGNPPVPLFLRRSARARRISLRVSRLDGRVTLTLPRGLPEAEALEFAESKADWIRGHLRERVDEVQIAIGATLPLEGQDTVIVPGTARRVVRGDGQIAVPSGAVAARMKSYVKTLARDRLVAASDHYAGLLGRPYARITLRDTRSRWGSCSSAGNLMYSWRLVLAPPPVLAYVAAHEVAHLAEMNHSPAFWSLVTRLHGPYDTPRRWLHSEGSDLHRYRFDPVLDQDG